MANLQSFADVIQNNKRTKVEYHTDDENSPGKFEHRCAEHVDKILDRPFIIDEVEIWHFTESHRITDHMKTGDIELGFFRYDRAYTKMKDRGKEQRKHQVKKVV